MLDLTALAPNDHHNRLVSKVYSKHVGVESTPVIVDSEGPSVPSESPGKRCYKRIHTRHINNVGVLLSSQPTRLSNCCAKELGLACTAPALQNTVNAMLCQHSITQLTDSSLLRDCTL